MCHWSIIWFFLPACTSVFSFSASVTFFFHWSVLFLNGPTSASLCLFSVFSVKHHTILQQFNVKNVHPVFWTRIQTNNLLILSLLPQPLDQGSRPRPVLFFLSIFLSTFSLSVTLGGSGRDIESSEKPRRCVQPLLISHSQNRSESLNFKQSCNNVRHVFFASSIQSIFYLNSQDREVCSGLYSSYCIFVFLHEHRC